MAVRTIKSSGNEKVDSAARKAIENSAPFEPLPKEYKDNSVAIDFTFDYNAIGGGTASSKQEIVPSQDSPYDGSARAMEKEVLSNCIRYIQ